ncbi:hypothetical protein [Cryobacterium fucosi]|uniref:Uncharacterized protein n=1 Tax=Cryobacterium fucosi TaxID=1259157 RepID=A0A4R9B8R1_9MICO|nr:hypothetical protein [Cryobacterium fucosi]TFD78285.1 hypothetical protein E3T48_07565 [Cryobacterium fucosi]
MTHSYPLYQAIRAQCFCCQALQSFTFTSATDQVVCAMCLHHLGDDKAERRDAEHVQLWLAQYADLQEVHRRGVEKANLDAAEAAATILTLTGQLDELRGLVAGRFDRTVSGDIRGLLENDLVRRAERRGMLALRQLDWAMAVIWRLGMLHHDDLAHPGSCVCGRPVTACAEGRALDPQRQAVRDWEKKNLALLAAAKRHGLPDDHHRVAGAGA